MRFYISLFFCFVCIFCSCGSAETPPGIIPKHEMATLLTDIHIVDGSLGNIVPAPDTLYKHGFGLYLAVFKEHHTDTLQFKKSLQFYALRPDLLREVYLDVIKSLSLKQDSLRKLDSLSTLKKQHALPKK